MQISEPALAKINLALHVTGRRDDGYHLIDSIVTFAGIGDRITARRAPAPRLTVSGPYAPALSETADNIILRALALFGEDTGVAVELEKNLPVAAGIGGGSADAAATLRAVARLCGRALPPAAQVLQLGADVPVCLAQRTARMQGVGEVLTPLALPDLPAVLVNPGISVATGPVFAALRNRSNPAISMETTDLHDARTAIAWLTTLRNDLQPGAIRKAPAIAEVLSALGGAGAALARMSGSGATCFGLFGSRDEAARAAGQLARDCPGWWVQETLLQTARDIT